MLSQTNLRIKKEMMPIGIIFALVAIFFWKVLLLQGSFLFSDIKYAYYPNKVLYAETLKNFSIPLWTNYIQCGFPAHAQGQIGTLYPLNLFFYSLLPTHIAFSYSLVFHFLLAGIFTYAYARTLNLGKTSSLASAITFTFSGFLVAHLVHSSAINVCIWLPLILLLIEAGFRKTNISYVLLAGVPMSFQLLAGHFQFALYSIFLSSLYFLFRLYTETEQGKIVRGIPKYLTAVVLMGLIGLCLSAVQLIPTYQLVQLSTRAQGTPTKIAGLCTFPPRNLITFIFPYFFGFGSPAARGDYWGAANFWELCGYVGVTPLVLSLPAVLNRKNKYSAFFFFSLLFSLLLALGGYTPLYSLLRHIPGFGYFQAPARFLYLSTFSFAMLAGIGLHNLTIQSNSRRNLETRQLATALVSLAAVVSAGIAVGNILLYFGKDCIVPYLPVLGFLHSKIILRWYCVSLLSPRVFVPFLIILLLLALIILWHKQKIPKTLFKALIVGLIIIDLFIFGIGYNPNTARAAAPAPPKTVNFLFKDRGMYRIFTILESEYLPTSIDSNLLHPEFNTIFHISSIGTWNPLTMRRHQNLLNTVSPASDTMSSADAQEIPSMKHLKLLGLLNVKYILTIRKINDHRLNLVYNKDVKIYENKLALPRVFVVPNFKLIVDEKKILKTLKSEQFDPRQTVILEKKPPLIDAAPSVPPVTSRAEITTYSPRRVAIRAIVTGDSFLVLGDTFYPGWKVYVDGKEDEIYQANYIFRAVYLKKGSHDVEFIYDPLLFKLGLSITVLTLLCLCAPLGYRAWVVARKRACLKGKSCKAQDRS